MKNLLTLLVALMLAACSSGNKEAGLQDSTIVADTLAMPAAADEPADGADIPLEMSDTSQLEIHFDETAGLVFERQEPYYTVSIVTKQYEASSDVTWYFDGDFSPIYFKETWAAEGNEGSTEFFIEGGNVMCAAIQESSDEKKWCYTTGGLRIYDGGSGDLLKELLPSGYGNDCNTELSRYMDILKAIIKEAEVKQEDENSYTLHIEKTLDVGTEVQEYTEVTIPKKVYDGIKD